MNEEHFAFFLDELPTVLPVFGTLNGYVETVSLCLVDLVSDVGVDRQSGGLDVCLAELAKASLTRRPVFLPDLELFIRQAFLLLAGPLVVLEAENDVVARVLERVHVLLKAKEGFIHVLSIRAMSSGSSPLVHACSTLTHFIHLSRVPYLSYSYSYILATTQ